MRASLYSGVVCVDLDGRLLILDTGSPVSLGDGSTHVLDGIACQTHPSLLLYSWDSVRESIPFDVSALIGTDQLEQSAFKLDINNSRFEWTPPFNEGKPMKQMTGVPVVGVQLMESEHSFFLDTGASITYVTSERLLEGFDRVGEMEDFHPLIGKFTAPIYDGTVDFAGVSMNTRLGVLPSVFSMSMEPFGITGILGTDILSKGVLSLDLKNELFSFVLGDEKKHIPHDSWAAEYDALFDASFGTFLQHFTDLTVETISSLHPAPAAVLDVGAGTGRLSIPLAESGYSVTAVDPSRAMLDQLTHRSPGEVKTHVSAIETFAIDEQFDLAVCVFTVSSYWLTEAQLLASLQVIHDHLVPGGSLIIDRTDEAAFVDTVVETDFVRREARVTPLGDSLFQFTENSEVIDDLGPRSVTDTFEIRYWTEEEMLEAVHAVGFVEVEDLSKRFAGSGASFYCMTRG